MSVARPGPADPVLRPAKMAGVLVASAPSRQEHPMYLPDEPVGQRKSPLEPTASMFHRSHVVRCFDHVVDGSSGGFLEFEQEEVGQGRLRTLDLRGEHRLLSDVHVHEEGSVGQQGRHAVQSAQADRGRLQHRPERTVHHRRGTRRQWQRHECPHPFTAGHGEFVSSCRSSVHPGTPLVAYSAKANSMTGYSVFDTNS